MRNLVLISIAITLLASLAASAAPYGVTTVCPQPTKNWRIGAMFAWYVNDDTRDELGNGYGFEIERSFGKLWNGDFSGAFAWRRVSKDVSLPVAGSFTNTLNHYSLLAKWRWGQGASPSNDGFYYGLGVGVSLTSVSLFGRDDDTTAAEGLAMIGYNFAHAWYLDLSYRAPISDTTVSADNVAAVLGYRF